MPRRRGSALTRARLESAETPTEQTAQGVHRLAIRSSSLFGVEVLGHRPPVALALHGLVGLVDLTPERSEIARNLPEGNGAETKNVSVLQPPGHLRRRGLPERSEPLFVHRPRQMKDAADAHVVIDRDARLVELD